MKTRSALKLICQQCQFVTRRGRVFVRCSINQKHKQRQGLSTGEGAPEVVVPLGVDVVHHIDLRPPALMSSKTASSSVSAATNVLGVTLVRSAF